MKDLNIEHDDIPLKCLFPDIYADMIAMGEASTRIWRKADIDEHYQHSFDLMMDDLKRYARNEPEHKNRLYLTTDYMQPCLVVADLSEDVLDATKGNIEGCVAFAADDLTSHNSNCFMVWIFEGKTISFSNPASSAMAAEMLTAFAPENLISLKHLRPHWYLHRHKGSLPNAGKSS